MEESVCGPESGSGSVSLTNGSGSGRPKNFRIRNTALNLDCSRFVMTFAALIDSACRLDPDLFDNKIQYCTMQLRPFYTLKWSRFSLITRCQAASTV